MSSISWDDETNGKRWDTMSGDVLSHSSPDPLSPALLGLLALNNPPPPGGGRSLRLSVCGCGRWVDLLASRYVVPLSRYRSFAIAVRFALRCGFCCLLAVAWDDGDVLISSSRRAVPSCVSCLLASRLALPSHLIARRLARRLPALRHDWTGRWAGSVGALCLLGSIL